MHVPVQVINKKWWYTMIDLSGVDSGTPDFVVDINLNIFLRCGAAHLL